MSRKTKEIENNLRKNTRENRRNTICRNKEKSIGKSRGKIIGENDYGYMTIEASLVIPIILIAVFIMLLGLIYAYERAYIQSVEYERLYSVPLVYIRADDVETYLDEGNYDAGIVYGELRMDTEYVSHLAVCEGELDIRGSSYITGRRELDCCSDRLRRWQVYDDIAEKQGH